MHSPRLVATRFSDGGDVRTVNTASMILALIYRAGDGADGRPSCRSRLGADLWRKVTQALLPVA